MSPFQVKSPWIRPWSERQETWVQEGPVFDLHCDFRIVCAGHLREGQREREGAGVGRGGKRGSRKSKESGRGRERGQRQGSKNRNQRIRRKAEIDTETKVEK